MTLTGSAAIGYGNELDNKIIGNAVSNTLFGKDGSDEIAGGAGADALDGGEGYDILSYAGSASGVTVDLAASKVSGGDAQGDTIVSFEGVIGSDQADTLTGDDIGNMLDGGKGIDILIGGKGNDIYAVRDSLDVVRENVGEGSDDLVQAWADYALAAEIENMVMLGEADLKGTGNELDNRIFGNVGHNRIDGGLGKDEMAGGLGNDIYVVDDAGDKVTEAEGAGIDGIETGLDQYVLGATIENLTLTGLAAAFRYRQSSRQYPDRE